MSLVTVKIRAIEGALRGQEYTFDRPARCQIGRALDCEIRLPLEAGEMDVSRHHCLLEVKPPEARIRDSGSLNGTYVNGVKIGQRMQMEPARSADVGPIADCLLHDGDEIKIGHNVLRVELTAEVEPDKAEPARADEV